MPSGCARPLGHSDHWITGFGPSAVRTGHLALAARLPLKEGSAVLTVTNGLRPLRRPRRTGRAEDGESPMNHPSSANPTPVGAHADPQRS